MQGRLIIISGEKNLCEDHHNFFTELNPESDFFLQYSAFRRGLIGELIYDSYGAYLSAVLDTQYK